MNPTTVAADPLGVGAEDRPALVARSARVSATAAIASAATAIVRVWFAPEAGNEDGAVTV